MIWLVSAGLLAAIGATFIVTGHVYGGILIGLAIISIWNHFKEREIEREIGLARKNLERLRKENDLLEKIVQDTKNGKAE